VEHNSWPTAPSSMTIIGLKELPESSDPLIHTHIHFGHCYKNQAGWSSFLARFAKGGGTLYDLEFLNDANGRRIAAFGFHAGFAGAAAGALAIASQKEGKTLGPLKPYASESEMIEHAKSSLGGTGKGVKALVMGALGRCGKGAIDCLRKIGLEESVFLFSPLIITRSSFSQYSVDILQWDMAETAQGGPFPEILDVDIFINCIYLSTQIPAFITNELIMRTGPTRKLSVVVDVSCDTTNPFNPVPIYSINTTFAEPTVPVDVGYVHHEMLYTLD
jgi:saccharopine dehydrogenase (NAD+, L-lysine forming)